MSISKILNWLGLIIAGALLLFAGLGLLILGQIGISYLTPILNTYLPDGTSITWRHVALYWIMLFGGIALFISSFIIFFKLVIKLFAGKA